MSNPKNYLIIGASSGIGQELFNQLKAEKQVVITASRRIVTGSDLHLQFDANTDELPVDQLPAVLDGLVYCPGSINLKPFHRLTEQEFLEDFKLNALGAVKTIQRVLPQLKNSPQSSILLFSTVAVQLGMPFHSSIAMAKGAVEGLTRSLAAELAPAVRVNCIAPSLTNTPLASRLVATAERRKASNDRHPLKRVGEVADIASLATFLLSSQSSWITGQVIHADGGISAVRI